MTHHLLGLVTVAVVASATVAQQPGGYPVPGPLNYLPYYPQQQNPASVRPPLSPYLNLLNGNNPALNYYYGVRPLVQNLNQPVQMPPAFNPTAPNRFFQPKTPARDAAAYPDPDDSKKFTLPSAGNPVVFGNSFGSSQAGAGGGGGRGYFNPKPSAAKTGGTPGDSKTAPPASIPKAR